MTEGQRRLLQSAILAGAGIGCLLSNALTTSLTIHTVLITLAAILLLKAADNL